MEKKYKKREIKRIPGGQRPAARGMARGQRPEANNRFTLTPAGFGTILFCFSLVVGAHRN